MLVLDATLQSPVLCVYFKGFLLYFEGLFFNDLILDFISVSVRCLS